MAALEVGAKAPDVELKTIEGKPFSLREELTHASVVLAFFKGSCPICQYTFPFLDRLHRAYGQKNVQLVGISQDDRKSTLNFIRDFNVSFPVLIDESDSYLVSNAYGLTSVPSVFWIGRDGEIEVSSVGWVKSDVEEIGSKMAQAGGAARFALFKPGEDVRDFRAG